MVISSRNVNSLVKVFPLTKSPELDIDQFFQFRFSPECQDHFISFRVLFVSERRRISFILILEANEIAFIFRVDRYFE